jgi:hypothetical protein
MMLRTAIALTVTLAMCPTAGASIARATGLAQMKPPVATVSSAALPPELVALEQKMEELQITSLRFAERNSITMPHSSHGTVKLLRSLTGTGISGEATISPQAANIVLTLFGHPLKLRVVDGTTYWYVHALAAKDHGRPWVKFGRGGLAELFTVNGKHVKQPATPETKIGEPPLAEPPFEGLRKMLAEADEVRELGAGTFEGQPVTTFSATLSPEQLEGDLASAAKLRLPPLPSATSQPAIVTLEVSFAQNGLPMRIIIASHTGETVISATAQISAIDFPLTIEPPPASKTITLARLRRLERRGHRHKQHRHKGHHAKK